MVFDTSVINGSKSPEGLMGFHSWVLNLLLDHTSELISVWDKRAELIFHTPVHERYFGNKMPQRLTDLLSFVHADDQGAIRKKVEESIFRKRDSRAVYRLTRYSGEVCYMETIFNPVFENSGELAYFVVVTRDITEMTLSSRKIKEKEQVYRSLFEYNPDGVFSLDLYGKFTSCNDECERLSGFALEELKEKHFTEMVNHKELRTVTSLIRKLKSGMPVTYEISILRKDGEPIDVRVTNLPIVVDNKVTGYFGIVKDITNAKKAEQKIFNLAYYDPLTNIPNRMYFDDKLQFHISNRTEFVLLILDIDRLKTINDNLGPNFGDSVLKVFASRMAGILKPEDTLARLTGDEFALLLKGRHYYADIIRFLDKVFNIVEQPMLIQGTEIVIQVSVGISRFPTDGNGREDLLKMASIALTKAKDITGNSYKTYSRTLEGQLYERFLLEKDLRKAFEREELSVHYQPLVNVNTYEVIGLEALIRWNHPIKGGIPPMEFIPLAEETGLMNHISEWVLKKAAMDTLYLNQLYGKNLFVTVNISSPQFRSQKFVKIVADIIGEVKIRNENLKLEITESLLMKDAQSSIKTLQEFQEMGIQSYIDDFGTGYSSLSYLKLLPISGVKIDKSFTASCISLDKDKAIVRAIINLAQTLNLKVTAEGVETREQLQLLQNYDCDYFQGYLFSKPVQIERIGELL